MKALRFLSQEKLLEYLEQEINQAADNYGVYSLDSQKYQNEHDPNDGFVGYAMQDIEPPCSLIFFDEPFCSEIEDDRIEVQYLMTEFLKLLDQIRYSIGISILHSKVKDSFIPEESEFLWLHYNNAIILSSVASDRLRDLLILGALKKPPREYKLYAHPFKSAVRYLNDFFHSYGFRGVTDSFAQEFLQEAEAMPIMAEKSPNLENKETE